MNVKSLNRLWWQEKDSFPNPDSGATPDWGMWQSAASPHFESWKEKQYCPNLESAPFLAQSCDLGQAVNFSGP